MDKDIEVLGLHPGRCSGMCGGTSYRQTSNPSVAWTKWTFFKINDDVCMNNGLQHPLY